MSDDADYDYTVTDIFHVDNIAEAIFGMQIGPGVIRTHREDKCVGEFCVVHNPSDHHMVDWPTNWRMDRMLMERICPHGTEHPDPDDLAFNVREGRDWQGVHGCDGCCKAPA